MKRFRDLKNLEKNLFLLNKNHQLVMSRLIKMYKNECRFYEGDIGFSDLLYIFNKLLLEECDL